MSEVKLCVDCKHFRRKLVGAHFSLCAKRLSLIDGSATEYATIARQYSCGREGRNFVPKEPNVIWAKVVSIFK